MKNYFTFRFSFIIIGIVVLCLLIAWILKDAIEGRQIRAIVTPSQILVGEQFRYKDSTANAKSYLWEFGDGNISHTRSGKYTFKKPGNYGIRLTVDGKYKKEFNLIVHSQNNLFGESSMASIHAPSQAIVGEYLVFKGEGNASQWRWEFGETGDIDAREKSVIYKYQHAGTYQVLLSTENTKYPIQHTITVMPAYSADSTGIQSLIAKDIKEKLQFIADQRPFNTYYYYIMHKYLRNNNATPVNIGNKQNDFYSYCQGLRLIGKHKVQIVSVSVDNDPEDIKYVTRIIVSQKDFSQ